MDYLISKEISTPTCNFCGTRGHQGRIVEIAERDPGFGVSSFGGGHPQLAATCENMKIDWTVFEEVHR